MNQVLPDHTDQQIKDLIAKIWPPGDEDCLADKESAVYLLENTDDTPQKKPKVRRKKESGKVIWKKQERNAKGQFGSYDGCKGTPVYTRLEFQEQLQAGIARAVDAALREADVKHKKALRNATDYLKKKYEPVIDAQTSSLEQSNGLVNKLQTQLVAQQTLVMMAEEKMKAANKRHIKDLDEAFKEGLAKAQSIPAISDYAQLKTAFMAGLNSQGGLLLPSKKFELFLNGLGKWVSENTDSV